MQGQDLGGVGATNPGKGDVVSAMDDQKQSRFAERAVKGGKPVFVEEEVLIIGVHFYPKKTCLFDLKDFGRSIDIIWMDRWEGNEPR